MKERGILFSAPMVRAILAGTKVQTRRLCRSQALLIDGGGHPFTQRWDEDEQVHWRTNMDCPYGMAGDRLWVRETWGVGSRPDPFGDYDGIEYRADEGILSEHEDLPCHPVQLPEGKCLGDYATGWRPSLHMPRWASRISLEITGVRVERLQDISGEDAKAEGISCPRCDCEVCMRSSTMCPADASSHIEEFAALWDSLNAKRAPWSSNPWVWVVSFQRVESDAKAAE